MNIEAYNLDSLRKLVRSLQNENRRLKEMLDKADIAYGPENVFEEKIEIIEEYDPDQGGAPLVAIERIIDSVPVSKKLDDFLEKYGESKISSLSCLALFFSCGRI